MMITSINRRSLNLISNLYSGLFLCLLFISFSGFTQTITVKQDSTGDFTTIQAAVDSAQNGDTVLVWPGTYFENVQIKEKSLVLGSLVLTTGDDNYKYMTIIDGNKSGSCIKLWNWNITEEVIINGFTLMHGSGANCGGVCGGGLFIEYTNIKINNCQITQNSCKAYGAGIYLYGSKAFLSKTTIYKNHAFRRGGGILLLNNSTLTFDTINRCNIYENYAAVGADFYKLGSPDTVYMAVDTFTVQNPDYYYAFSLGDDELPQNDVVFDIIHHKIEQDSTDLYVAPWGDNTNSGVSPDKPLRTISYALLKMASDSASPDTIHVANGIYSFTSGEQFPLSLKGFVTLKGDLRDSTILDAENSFYHIRGFPTAKEFGIINFTIKRGNGNKDQNRIGSCRFGQNSGLLFENILFTENKGDNNSCCYFFEPIDFHLNNVEFYNNIGGVALSMFHGSTHNGYDTVFINNCRFIRNYPDYNGTNNAIGGGIKIRGMAEQMPLYTTVIITNTLFVNSYTNKGGSVTTSLNVTNSAKVFLTNCTFTESSSDSRIGANIIVKFTSELYIYNSIMYNNYPSELLLSDYSSAQSNTLHIYNSLIEGGESGIQIQGDGNFLFYDSSNIEVPPIFSGNEKFPYSLSAESPCINKGTMDLPKFIVDNMLDVDLAGNPRIYDDKIDMGAYEWNSLGINNPDDSEKNQSIIKVYPNPFSSITQISVNPVFHAKASIEIYNTSGCLVRTFRCNELLGSCQILWDGADNSGNMLPSGIYYVVLKIDGVKMESMKVVKN